MSIRCFWDEGKTGVRRRWIFHFTHTMQIFLPFYFPSVSFFLFPIYIGKTVWCWQLDASLDLNRKTTPFSSLIFFPVFYICYIDKKKKMLWFCILRCLRSFFFLILYCNLGNSTDCVLELVSEFSFFVMLLEGNLTIIEIYKRVLRGFLRINYWCFLKKCICGLIWTIG